MPAVLGVRDQDDRDRRLGIVSTGPRPIAQGGDRSEALPRTGVLFFSTPGCGTCRSVRAHIADLDDRADAPIVEVAAEANRAATARFEVRAAPTLIALRNGEEVARRIGPASSSVIEQIRNAAVDDSMLRLRTVSGGLIALRLVVALLLAAVGVLTTATSLWVIGAAIAIWAVVPLASMAHESRSR